MTPTFADTINLEHGMKFFVAEHEIKPIENIKTLPFCELPFSTLHLVKQAINENLAIKLDLHDLHPASEIRRIEQFAVFLAMGICNATDILDSSLFRKLIRL